MAKLKENQGSSIRTCKLVASAEASSLGDLPLANEGIMGF
jgi:hypothetical protein